MNHVPGADFTGLAHAPMGAPFYALATLVLLAAAYAGRRGKLAGLAR